MDLRIGTSGFHYKHWIGNFYPARMPAPHMLAHYVECFDCVELNNTFYMLPKIETLQRWRDATPAAFQFAVKGSGFITHNKKLSEPRHALQNLIPRVTEGLGKKLGPILFQTPPQWQMNTERLREFLAALPRHLRFAFEFRHASWHCTQVYELLSRYNAAFCIYEIAGLQAPIAITADWTYVRLHGPGQQKYQGNYSHSALQGWAERIAAWSALSAVHLYFDNDHHGYAAANALALKRLIAPLGQRRVA